MIAHASRCSTLTLAARAILLRVLLAIGFGLTLSSGASAENLSPEVLSAKDVSVTGIPAAEIDSTLNSGALKPNLQANDSLFQNTKPAQSQSIVQGGSVLQVLVSLAFIIVLIYAGAWYFRRMQLGSGTGQSMRVVSAISVGTRERVVLVQVGEQQLLLGVAPGRVNLLQQLEQGSGQLVEPNDQSDSQDSQAMMNKSFAKILADRIPGSQSAGTNK